MRLRDFLRFAGSGLWRQKVRSLLTLAGVAVGACSMAMSLSVGVGLRAMIEREFTSRPRFWEITVYAMEAKEAIPEEEVPVKELATPGLTGERAARMRQVLLRRYRKEAASKRRKGISEADITKMQAFPEVAEVKSFRAVYGQMKFPSEDHVESGMILFDDLSSPQLQDRLAAGRLPRPGQLEVALVESQLYDLGIRTDAQFETLLGRRIEFLPYSQPPVPYQMIVAEIAIVGILKDQETSPLDRWFSREAQGHASILGVDALLAQAPNWKPGQYDQVIVYLRPGSDLPAMAERIKAMGFEISSAADWFSSAKRQVTATAAALNIFAWISLLVAGFGITNTLVTNVIERTREIGILKAIGASRRQVLALFLFEGALIGLVGGVAGLIAARLLAGPADIWVRAEIESQARGEKLASQPVFEFPAWLLLSTFAVAVLATTLAAVIPARRAANVMPVDALKAA